MDLGGHSCPLPQGKGVTTYLEKFVTDSDSSTGCRTLLRHSRDENALEDIIGVKGAEATGQQDNYFPQRHPWPALWRGCKDPKHMEKNSGLLGPEGCSQLLGRL